MHTYKCTCTCFQKKQFKAQSLMNRVINTMYIQWIILIIKEPMQYIKNYVLIDLTDFDF